MFIKSKDDCSMVLCTLAYRGNMPGKENIIHVVTNDTGLGFRYDTVDQAKAAMNELFNAVKRGDNLFSFPTEGLTQITNDERKANEHSKRNALDELLRSVFEDSGSLNN